MEKYCSTLCEESGSSVLHVYLFAQPSSMHKYQVLLFRKLGVNQFLGNSSCVSKCVPGRQANEKESGCLT